MPQQAELVAMYLYHRWVVLMIGRFASEQIDGGAGLISLHYLTLISGAIIILLVGNNYLNYNYLSRALQKCDHFDTGPLAI